jgi:hypothetical protein
MLKIIEELGRTKGNMEGLREEQQEWIDVVSIYIYILNIFNY